MTGGTEVPTGARRGFTAIARRAGAGFSVLAMILGLAGTASAQSLFAVGGLGSPVEGLDARARALGSIGVGLPGYSFYHSDPTGSAGVPAPLLQASMQPTWGVITGGEEDLEFRSTRFPHLAFAYPVGESGTVFLNYSAYLDQRFRQGSEEEANLGGEQVLLVDEYESDGGISAISVGWAQQLGETFALGGSAGIYTGRLRRTLTRTFSAEDLGAEIPPYVVEGQWTTTAPRVIVGARWDPRSIVRIAASVEWSGDLDVKPAEGTERGAQKLDLPMVYRIGGSANLTSALSLVAGLSYSNLDEGSSGAAQDATESAELSWGTGLEFTGLSLLGRGLPLRLGYRATDYPFEFEGSAVKESVFSGGLGFAFASNDDYPTALLEMGIEKGKRTAGIPVEEEFWRATFSLRLSGG
jgi:hypothetical protein